MFFGLSNVTLLIIFTVWLQVRITSSPRKGGLSIIILHFLSSFLLNYFFLLFYYLPYGLELRNDAFLGLEIGGFGLLNVVLILRNFGKSKKRFGIYQDDMKDVSIQNSKMNPNDIILIVVMMLIAILVISGIISLEATSNLFHTKN